MMKLKGNYVTVVVSCNACGKDCDFVGKDGWEAEDQAAGEGYLCCNPVHVCPECQTKITRGELEVAFKPVARNRTNGLDNENHA